MKSAPYFRAVRRDCFRSTCASFALLGPLNFSTFRFCFRCAHRDALAHVAEDMAPAVTVPYEVAR